MMDQYDLIVIGAGPGGYEAAIRAAQNGLKTALIEAREAGGTCLNRGCIPTKSLLHSAGLYHELQQSEVFGIRTENISFSWDGIYDRKDQVVNQLRTGVETLLSANKIDLIRGRGRIIGAHQIAVDTAEGELQLNGANILIAAGSVPALPPIEGLDLPGVVTSDDILASAPKDCKKIIIIGGGVIGIEFATVLISLGVQVTVIEALERILPSMDREISQNTRMILKKRGVEFYDSTMVQRIEQTEGLQCHVISKGKELTIAGDLVLAAIGRRANTETLFGSGFSVEMERGAIKVGQNFQTSIPSIYAVGDVISGSIQLAHAASAQGLNAVACISGRKPEINLNLIPSCIYTNPEIAAVGMTAEQAKNEGRQVLTGKYVTSSQGKALIENQERGFIKLVFEAETKVILGAQIMCARATDFINEITTAIANQLTLEDLTAVIRPHPTFAEAVTEAAESVKSRAIHAMPKR